MVVQALGRVLRPGRVAQADRHDPQLVQHAVSAVYEQRHLTAEVRRARGLRARRLREAGVLRWRRRHRGHHPQRHRPVRYPQRIPPDLLQRPLSERGAPHRRLHEHPERRRREPAVARGLGRVPAAVVRHDDLRYRGLRPPDVRHPARPELRRQLPPQQLRHLDCARRRRPQRRRCLRAGRDLPHGSVPMAGREAAWTSSRPSTTPSSRPGRR